jgi:hypothetical protein
MGLRNLVPVERSRSLGEFDSRMGRGLFEPALELVKNGTTV